jgi:3-oxocholest-4-en-26-oyl-CoA dehydrogenase beta subunit
MDFNLNKQEDMLKKSARDFLSVECPSDLVREMAEEDKGFPKKLWDKMAGLGWMGLGIPENYGGTGGSFLEQVVLMEEMGRVCMPGPFFTATVLGASMVAEAGTLQQKMDLLTKSSEGGLIITPALLEEAAVYDPAWINLNASRSNDEFILNGVKLFVPDAHVSDYMICAARTAGGPDGITLFVVDAKSDGICLTPLHTLAGNKLFEVVLNNVKVSEKDMLGEMGKGWPHIQRVIEKASTAVCAQMVGASQRALEMAVEHSKIRVQFGRPVGSFQAVQFLLADTLTDVDGARLITYLAAARISEGKSCAKEVSMAKAWVSEAYNRVMTRTHQVIGGVGIMADYDMPLFSKRALGWRFDFGDAAYHRNVVARELGL